MTSAEWVAIILAFIAVIPAMIGAIMARTNKQDIKQLRTFTETGMAKLTSSVVEATDTANRIEKSLSNQAVTPSKPVKPTTRRKVSK